MQAGVSRDLLYHNREYKITYVEGVPKNENREENEDYGKLKEQLMEKMSEIHEVVTYDKNAWRAHTKALHPYTRIGPIFKEANIQTSQALCKLLEILTRYPEVIPQHCKDNLTVKSFHLCEGPGYFIGALDLYFCSHCPNMDWIWKATTLNPYYENISSIDKLSDDPLMVNHMKNWYFGEDNSGDIKKIDKRSWARMNKKGYYDLVTADGSIYVQDNPGQQEELVMELISTEIEHALELVATNGTFILKMFTMYEQKTRKMIEQVAAKFDNCIFFKPFCSKSGNSERYVIFTGFDRRQWRRIAPGELYKCEEVFTMRQVTAIYRNLRTFQKNETNRERKEKKRLIDTILEKMKFQVITRPRRVSHILPEFTALRRPWMAIMQYNLIEKVHAISQVESARECLRLFAKKKKSEMAHLPEFPFFPLTFLKLDENSWVRASDSCLIRQDYICTSEPIVMNHTLFLDPIALCAMNVIDKDMYKDVFSGCSVDGIPQLSADNGFLIECCQFDNFAYVEFWLRAIMVMKENSVILRFTSPKTPLMLSRLSSSIFALFCSLFNIIQFRNQDIVLCGYRADNAIEIVSFLMRISGNIHGRIRNLISITKHAEIYRLIYLFNIRVIATVFLNNPPAVEQVEQA